MMAFRHGSSTMVAVAGDDISAFLNEADAAQSFDTAETSHFGTQHKTYLLGEDDGTFSIKGMFDGAVGAIDDISADMQVANLQDAIIPITIANDGGFTTGRRAKCGLVRVTGWEVDSPVGDVVSVSGDFQATGGIKHGVVLSGSTRQISGMSADVNNGAATVNGAQAFVHVMNDTTGTVTVVVQHSDDGTAWVDLIALDAVAAGDHDGLFGSVAGTVNQHLRANITLAGTGDARVIVSAARN